MLVNKNYEQKMRGNDLLKRIPKIVLGIYWYVDCWNVFSLYISRRYIFEEYTTRNHWGGIFL